MRIGVSERSKRKLIVSKILLFRRFKFYMRKITIL